MSPTLSSTKNDSHMVTAFNMGRDEAEEMTVLTREKLLSLAQYAAHSSPPSITLRHFTTRMTGEDSKMLNVKVTELPTVGDDYKNL